MTDKPDDVATEQQLRDLFGMDDEDAMASVIATHSGQWIQHGSVWRFRERETLSIPTGVEIVAPNPAPDAMREALERISRYPWDDKNSNDAKIIGELACTALSAPVPPADGASETLMGPGIDKLFERDDLFTARAVCARLQNFGYNITLFPSPAVAAEPVAWRFELASARIWDGDTPKEYTNWHWKISETKPNAGEAMRNVMPLYTILSLPVQPVTPPLPQDTLDRLAMLNVSEDEVYEVLKKHLSEDMINGIWQEIKEACRFADVQSGADEWEREAHAAFDRILRKSVIEECAQVKVKIINMGARSDEYLIGFEAACHAFIEAIRTLSRSAPAASPNGDK